jgi:hypothetical protein
MNAAPEDLIKHSDQDDWSDFEDRVKNLEPNDLAAIADYLGTSMQQDWHDYATDFAEFSWQDFIEAYEHVMHRPY